MLDAPRVLQSLTENNVEYIVIGGLAMVTHGSAHVTEDLDICYKRSPENFAALVSAFALLHPTLRGAP